MSEAAPFATNEEALAAFRAYSMANYDPAPVAFTRGRGARLWDVEGKEYLDFAAGVAVASLGHGHPALAQALAEQAGRLIHVSNLYLIPPQLELARRLAELSGLHRAFFCNSGTEAIEAALKLARLWGHGHGGRYRFVAARRGFHGRTLGALSVTGQPHYHHGFEPLVPGVDFVDYGDADAVRRAITNETCAVLVEPIQGEGGVHVPPGDYLKRLRELCDERGVLLVLDEVQTGIGRTGSWFAYEPSGIRPDIVALAKGLGGGFPIGAVLADDEAAVFQPGNHGSTFGGNYLASTAALTTLRVLAEDGVLENVRAQSRVLEQHLRVWAEERLLGDARGQGLLWGVDLPAAGAKAFARRLLGEGLLVTTTGDSTLRLCPPLVLDDAETSEGLGMLGAALGARPGILRRET